MHPPALSGPAASSRTHNSHLVETLLCPPEVFFWSNPACITSALSCEVKKHTLDEEHEVEKVLDVRGMADERFYLVKWKGWKSEFNSWRNWRDLENAMDEIDDFWETTDWIRDRPAWIEGEIRCRNCCKDRTTAGKPFKSMKSIKDHHKCRWKKPSRKGTLAEKAVIKKRRVACHDKAGTVQIEGVDLKPAQAFKYLGYKATSDGDTSRHKRGH